MHECNEQLILSLGRHEGIRIFPRSDFLFSVNRYRYHITSEKKLEDFVYLVKLFDNKYLHLLLISWIFSEIRLDL